MLSLEMLQRWAERDVSGEWEDVLIGLDEALGTQDLHPVFHGVARGFLVSFMGTLGFWEEPVDVLKQVAIIFFFNSIHHGIDFLAASSQTGSGDSCSWFVTQSPSVFHFEIVASRLSSCHTIMELVSKGLCVKNAPFKEDWGVYVS